MLMKLNIGCGRHNKKGYVNLDVTKLPGVDVAHDLDKFPYPFKDNTFEEVTADYILEHVGDLVRVMRELHRICKPNAFIRINVPYYNSQGAFQDPTHKWFFTLTTFDYFTQDSFFDYYTNYKFEIIRKEAMPTKLGRLIPRGLRNKLSLVLGEIIREIYFELKVIK